MSRKQCIYVNALALSKPRGIDLFLCLSANIFVIGSLANPIATLLSPLGLPGDCFAPPRLLLAIGYLAGDTFHCLPAGQTGARVAPAQESILNTKSSRRILCNSTAEDCNHVK